jgi:putative SOS response-associated peptidase YedK
MAPLTFAGLWERWGPDKLMILTTDAADGISGLHTRMPVMLAESPGCRAKTPL